MDSAVAAYLLKQQGYEVIGVTLRTSESPTRCCEIDDARACAEAIGIPYRVFNCSGEFDRKVVAPFVESYCSGQTPNPCVICNREVKWEQMIYAANVLGAEFIATGHYAHIVRLESGRYSVRTADCAAKDQTYMLYRLSQEQLARTLMPLGGLSKDEVRRIAAEAAIPVAQKADSQEICFVPDDDYAKFIREYLKAQEGEGAAAEGEPACEAGAAGEAADTEHSVAGEAAGAAESPMGEAAEGFGPFTEGNFVDRGGRVLGRHKGIANYTVGQRKGLGIALGEPAYVHRIDKEKNEVVLGPDEALWTDTVYCRDVNFVGMAPEECGCTGRGAGEESSQAEETGNTRSQAEETGNTGSRAIRAKAKVRYQHRAADCSVSVAERSCGALVADGLPDECRAASEAGGPILKLKFDAPVRAAAPGQSAVVYDENGCVLCGGIIVK